MTWKVEPVEKSLRCNGTLVRSFRRQRGWTQKRLATLSGYSERLVRKAESGDTLDPETIAVLAATFSQNGDEVAPDDLCQTAQMLVQSFLEFFVKQGIAGVKTASESFFSDELVIWVAGDPNINPCAGEWRGPKALTRYFDTLLSNFDVTGLEPTFSSHGNEVFVLGIQRVRVLAASEEAVVWGVNQYRVERGRIVLWKNHYDTATVERLILRARDSNHSIAHNCDDNQICENA